MSHPAIPTAPGFLVQLLALYAYLLPLLLYVLWSALALTDLSRRSEATAVKRGLWAAAVFFVPYLGAAAYLLLGGAQTPRAQVRTLIGGGLAAYLLVLLVGLKVGGLA
jgi:hypothetical protein